MEDFKTDMETSWNSTKIAAENILLPVFEEFEHRPHDEKDFIDIKPKLEEAFITLINNLKSTSTIDIEVIPASVKLSIVYVLLSCGEHSEANTWTTPLTLKSSIEIQNILCKLCSCQNIKQIICNGSNFKNALSNLRVKLVRDKWKCSPAAVVSFKWLLFHVEMPQLGEVLSEVFPPTFLILDDFENENKILGSQMMHHIINNVTRAELRRQQYDDVIFDALHRLTYEKGADLVLPVTTCLTALITKMDSSFTQQLGMGRLDRSLQVFLIQMEGEQAIDMRQAYAASLPLLLKAGGLSLVRWSQRLLRIVADYLAIEDGSQGQTQLHTLQALHMFLEKTWPRAASLASQALSTLLRLVCDLTQEPSSLVVPPATRAALLAHSELCLSLLCHAAPSRCRDLLQGAESLTLGEEFQGVISNMRKICENPQKS